MEYKVKHVQIRDEFKEETEYKYTYDENDRIMYVCGSAGSHTTYHYENGNLVWVERSNGYDDFYDYDPNGNCIHAIHDLIGGDTYEEWMEYDSNGNLIHLENSNGYAEWHNYDNKNRLISTKILRG